MKRLILLSLCIAVTFMPSSAAVKSSNILIVPFKNLSAAKFSWISGGMTDTIIADLRRTGVVNVFSDEDRKKAIREIEIAMTGITGDPDAAAGKIMGANLICSGSYTVAGNDVRVVAKLTDAATTKTERAVKIDGKLDHILDLQDSIVSALMDEAGAMDLSSGGRMKFSDDSRKRAVTGYKPSAKSFELYSRALEKVETDTKGALALARQAIKEDKGYINPLILAASISSNNGDVKGASAFFDEAVKIAGTSGGASETDRAWLYHSMAVNEWNRGQYGEALGHSSEAVKLLEKNSQLESAFGASVFTILGASQRALNDNDTALASTIKAVGILEKNGMSKTSAYAWTLANLSVIYLQKGENDKALKACDDAGNIWAEIGLKRSTGYVFNYSQTGSVYYVKGDYRKGISYLTEGMKLCRDLSLDNTVQYAYFSWNLANCFWMTTKYCDGIPHMKKTVAIFKSLGSNTLPQAEKSLGDFQRQCGK